MFAQCLVFVLVALQLKIPHIFLSISVWSSYFVFCLNLVLGGDVSWNDLVQNPAKWWDNRLDKVTHFLNCPCVLKSLQNLYRFIGFCVLS